MQTGQVVAVPSIWAVRATLEDRLTGGTRQVGVEQDLIETVVQLGQDNSTRERGCLVTVETYYRCSRNVIGMALLTPVVYELNFAFFKYQRGAVQSCDKTGKYTALIIYIVKAA